MNVRQGTRPLSYGIAGLLGFFAPSAVTRLEADLVVGCSNINVQLYVVCSNQQNINRGHA